ncbi:MAG: hypothetical protein GC147_08125 [Porphyrobacter sp.]|nr:hypothetical protein [Porphyrobacter sp.]
MSSDPFRDICYPPISGEAFAALRASEGAKRIDFADSHKGALRPFENGKSTLKLPFASGISRFLPLPIYASKFDSTYYRTNGDLDEHEQIQSWITENVGLVFIKSLATSAVAACSHIVNDALSEIGALEKAAKYEGDIRARRELVRILCEIYDRLHSPLGIQAIVAVPASRPGKFNLPTCLADGLAHHTGIEDLSSKVFLEW